MGKPSKKSLSRDDVSPDKIRDKSGREVGRVGSFGDIRNAAGRTVGHIDSFGKIHEGRRR
jgi:hypothetical protein